MRGKFKLQKEAYMAIVYTSLAIIICMIIIPTTLIRPRHENITDKDMDVISNNIQSNTEILFSGDETISVYITETGTIEEINIEEYVCGVVANEMPANFNIEALKAQAVASRTYLASKSFNKCTNGNGADICNSVHCQVYTSKEVRMSKWEADKAEEHWNKIEQAVQETKGQVMSYNNELVLYPQFFSTSSGQTENSEDANWGEIPYLRSVKSNGEEIAPKYTSEKIVDIDEFIEDININYPEANLLASDIGNSIEVLSRSEAGGVTEMQIGNKNIEGSEFRFLVGLNSTNFTYEIEGGNIVFNCKGYGHGVGMSQWGAQAMAESGSNYDEILKHYYTGININNLKFE